MTAAIYFSITASWVSTNTLGFEGAKSSQLQLLQVYVYVV